MTAARCVESRCLIAVRVSANLRRVFFFFVLLSLTVFDLLLVLFVHCFDRRFVKLRQALAGGFLLFFFTFQFLFCISVYAFLFSKVVSPDMKSKGKPDLILIRLRASPCLVFCAIFL